MLSLLLADASSRSSLTDSAYARCWPTTVVVGQQTLFNNPRRVRMSSFIDDALVVDRYVWMLDPHASMEFQLPKETQLRVLTAPGCWGPMITPDYPSSHEVSAPTFIEGAEVGDAIAIEILEITPLSAATTSGTHSINTSHVSGDPGVSPICPGCGRVNPQTSIDISNPTVVRCIDCSAPVAPYTLSTGYTMVFDDAKTVGITVSESSAAAIRNDAHRFMCMPPHALQYSANLLARGNKTGIATRVQPMIGNIGTLPLVRIPSSRNVGDLAKLLSANDTSFNLTETDLENLTDSHLDINEVRAGAILLAPVRVKGAGLFMGDVHAMQGDGELAGHTTDIVAEVRCVVHVLKGLNLPGPILLPKLEDLPGLLKPLTQREWQDCVELAAANDTELGKESLGVEFIGTGDTINEAIDQAIRRVSKVTGWTEEDVRNRATLAGGVRVGRLPGVVQLGVKITPTMAREWGVLQLLSKQYGKHYAHLMS